MPEAKKREMHLRLFVAGNTSLSRLATLNLRNILSSIEGAEPRLEIIDVINDPIRGITERIIATPTLDKISPLPRERMIGDLSEHQKVRSILIREILPEVFDEKED